MRGLYREVRESGVGVSNTHVGTGALACAGEPCSRLENRIVILSFAIEL